MIKKSYVPFYQSLIFLFLLAFVASVSKNTCISTRKQQQLGENKKIRLWSIGNSYFGLKTRLLKNIQLMIAFLREELRLFPDINEQRRCRMIKKKEGQKMVLKRFKPMRRTSISNPHPQTISLQRISIKELSRSSILPSVMSEKKFKHGH